MAVKLDATTIRRDQTGDHVEHRRLAGSVRTEQADRFATTHGKTNALHDLAAAKTFFDAMDGKKILAFLETPRGIFQRFRNGRRGYRGTSGGSLANS